MNKLLLFFIVAFAIPVNGAQIDINGPAGSGAFGTVVTVLPNGNFVVTDPFYDEPGGQADVGAVYLYSGSTLSIISVLKGGTASDQAGDNGITVLTNGNYLVKSRRWFNPVGSAANAGAVTWCSMTTGCDGVVSAANSLVGTSPNDGVGGGLSTIALTNGNYVVGTPGWDNGATQNVGAAVWCNGTTGRTGSITPAIALIGSGADDFVGNPVALTNGNYVIPTDTWDNGSQANVGAVTWGNGTAGTTGIVGTGNSIIGSTAGDQIGLQGVVPLTNGNYVVRSNSWDGAAVDVGAVTWASGSGPTALTVSSANSLVGGTANDRVGGTGNVLALANGNYVVFSLTWDNPTGSIANAGAVTWGNGSSGTSGLVSSGNSMVGNSAQNRLSAVTALANGNYLVINNNWSEPPNSQNSLGAVTWCSGSGPTTGPQTLGNSLVGATTQDQVGSGGVVALANGNYVVGSPFWDNVGGGISNAGAATFCNGATGVVGTVTGSGSLIGAQTGDVVGSVWALSNGNYIVGGRPSSGGSATFCSGSNGCGGVISAGNSLFGTPTSPINTDGVTALTNGNYLVKSSQWSEGGPAAIGAITFGSGTAGASGTVTSSNSLIGSTANDRVGADLGVTAVRPLSDGNYVVFSPVWDNGPIVNAGAVTLGNGTVGTFGSINSSNSILGTVTGGGFGADAPIGYDSQQKRLFVGRPPVNIVSLIEAPRVTISGRIFASNGVTGLRNAIVSLTDSNNVVRTTTTSSFGFYSFDNVIPGGTYTLRVSSRLFRFQPQPVTPSADLGGVDLVGLE